MKLFRDLINKRLENYINFQEAGHYIMALWHLFGAYLVALNLTGIKDKTLSDKIFLWQSIFSKLSKKESGLQEDYQKLMEYSSSDINIINNALNILETSKRLNLEMGDIFPEKDRDKSLIAVSVYDSP